MTAYTLTIRQDQLAKLASSLFPGTGEERAAYLICRTSIVGRDPWSRSRLVRLLVVEVRPVPDSDVVDASPLHVTWHTRSLVAALKHAEQLDAVVAVVHAHPTGMANFSGQDDKNEPDLVELVQNRNGPATFLPSIILSADGVLVGRVWESPKFSSTIRTISVVGDFFELHYVGRGSGRSRAELHRQELAFGKSLTEDLARLRVGVVGCGGTGSAVAMLLARLGVGQVLLIDSDIVEETNLNRLHFARRQDADAMLPKAEVLKRGIAELGLGVRAIAVNTWVGDVAARDALRACDIVFGCTDDHDGRLFLNRFAYYYLIPVLDVGLAMEVTTDMPPSFAALESRVTVLLPGTTCLACRGIADATLARDESLRRSSPAAYERLRAERYVVGGGNASPAVVTFTTETATMAVSEMLHRFTRYRGGVAPVANRLRKFMSCEDFHPGAAARPGCPACGRTENWGRGDVDPFLDRVE